MLNPKPTDPNRPMKRVRKPQLNWMWNVTIKQNGPAGIWTHSPHKPVHYPSTELAGQLVNRLQNPLINHIRLKRICITLCLHIQWLAFRLLPGLPNVEWVESYVGFPTCRQPNYSAVTTQAATRPASLRVVVITAKCVPPTFRQSQVLILCRASTLRSNRSIQHTCSWCNRPEQH